MFFSHYSHCPHRVPTPYSGPSLMRASSVGRGCSRQPVRVQTCSDAPPCHARPVHAEPHCTSHPTHRVPNLSVRWSLETISCWKLGIIVMEISVASFLSHCLPLLLLRFFDAKMLYYYNRFYRCSSDNHADRFQF